MSIRRDGEEPQEGTIQFTNISGNPISGAETMFGQILEYWVEVDGVRIDGLQVPIGKVFMVGVELEVNWPDYGFPYAWWIVGVTAMGDGVQVYGAEQVFAESSYPSIPLNKPNLFVMPGSNLSLDLKVWGSLTSEDLDIPPWGV